MPEPADRRRGTRRVVVAGASGLIGSALVESLRADGVEVTTLVRRPPERPDEVEWLTGPEPLDPAVLDGRRCRRRPERREHRPVPVDVVLQEHAAVVAHHSHPRDRARGAGTRERMLRPSSRRRPSATTARRPAGASPRVPRGASRSSPISAASGSPRRSPPATDARVALLRTAPIVHRDGVLKPLLLLTGLGLSGPIGRGTQVWPWISLDDEVRAIRHVIDSRIAGPVNLSGPTRATANDLGFALAVRMNRPFLLRAPVWGMKLVLGADATEALLTADMNVVPAVLEESGFTFTHPTVEDAVASAVPPAGDSA